MDWFTKFVQENVEQTESSKTEHVILLPKEVSKAFQHYCRKRNITFNEAINQLVQEAIKRDQKKPIEPEKENDPNPRLFMNDAY